MPVAIFLAGGRKIREIAMLVDVAIKKIRLR
jgi:hypothetical protein